MKTRNGFVSNSSSSSFLIYGLHDVDHNKIIDEFEKLVTQGKFKKPENWPEKYEGVDDWDYYSEAFYAIEDITYLETYEVWDTYYIGGCYTQMGFDETRRGYEERVRKLIKLLVPSAKDSDFRVHQQAWRDG